jgi:hypothetical protein
MATSQRRICVTYRSTPEASWRCTLYVLFHRWQILLIHSTIALGIGLLLSASAVLGGLLPAHLAIPFLSAVGFVFWWAFIGYGIWLEMGRRFPTPDTERICTSCLTCEGFLDISPNGEKLRNWSDINSIREHKGDVYIRVGVEGGHFIPREAWLDAEEALAFYHAALALWESGGELWPE